MRRLPHHPLDPWDSGTRSRRRRALQTPPLPLRHAAPRRCSASAFPATRYATPTPAATLRSLLHMHLLLCLWHLRVRSPRLSYTLSSIFTLYLCLGHPRAHSPRPSHALYCIFCTSALGTRERVALGHPSSVDARSSRHAGARRPPSRTLPLPYDQRGREVSRLAKPDAHKTADAHRTPLYLGPPYLGPRPSARISTSRRPIAFARTLGWLIH